MPSASVIPQSWFTSMPNAANLSSTMRGAAVPAEKTVRRCGSLRPSRSSQSMRVSHIVGTPQVIVTRSRSYSS